MTRFTVVMYHYVRDIASSAYPGIKGLEKKLFAEQVGYIKKHYNVIRMEDVILALDGGAALPPRALLLTFDDGYKDHSLNALPILYKQGIQGTFFIPGKAMAERKVLDVNKIHFILAVSEDPAGILWDIENIIRDRCDRQEAEEHLRLMGSDEKSSRRYDAGPVSLIKDMLQKKLPRGLRETVADELFRKHVAREEDEFADELYMNTGDIAIMREAGMYIGSHSYDHLWLDDIGPDEQRSEFEKSMSVLREIGCCRDHVVFSYPYGANNISMIDLLKEKGVKAAFTSRCDLAMIKEDARYLIPRLDTNDLPKNSMAEPCSWTTELMKDRL